MGDEHLILLHHDRDHFLGEMVGIVQAMITFAHKRSQNVSQSPRCPVLDRACVINDWPQRVPCLMDFRCAIHPGNILCHGI